MSEQRQILIQGFSLQSFNRHSHMYPGLAAEHKLAEYLKTFELLDKTSGGLPNTHRTRFLRHVVGYNVTQVPRRRFYLLNLTSADLEYLADFNMWPSRTHGGDYKKKLVWASTGVESDAENLIAPPIISDIYHSGTNGGALSNNTNRFSGSILANGIHKDFRPGAVSHSKSIPHLASLPSLKAALLPALCF
jgi:hypothetical protein